MKFTLTSLLMVVTVLAIILTVVVKMGKKSNNLLVSFLQNFCGTLFVISGAVKAVDPLGTAYKMEQYFAEFESVFEGTVMGFMAPLFPLLNELALPFSVIMIVFEIVLGVMLLIGARPKFTAWAFLLLVLFFTALTGFTYLTGYVPADAHFFSFSQWGPWVETNMKVTDCGCFGDFIKLKPYTSFLKDVFLLVPAFLFIFTTKSMHQWFSKGVRTALIALTLFGVTLYCFSNFSWDIPHADFRPFSKGANVAETKQKEAEAAENVEITHYKITNKETGQVIKLPYEQYMKEFANYPTDKFDLDQIKTEPEIEATKISDFEVTDVDGNDMTEDILTDPNYSFMIVAYKIKSESESKVVTVQDSIYVIDTLAVQDTFQLVRRLDKIIERKEQREVYHFDEGYTQPWKDVVVPLAEKAEAAGYKVYTVTGFADPAKLDDFRHEIQAAFPFYTADDILLKTIVRSNPGIVLWKNGTIIDKWHYKKMPAFEEITF